MTFRAKPVVKRSDRPLWDVKERRNFLLNLGFGLIVVAAVLILVVTAAATWYDDRFGAVATVDGQTITKEQYRNRYRVEIERLEIARSRIRTELTAGRLTPAQAQAQERFLAQRQEQLPALVLERLIDAHIQGILAGQEGIAVTDAAIDARLVEEATSPEQRHAWVIEVAPERDDGAAKPTSEQRAAAKAVAEGALRDLEAGQSWEDVARTVSTAANAPTGGDLGWVNADGVTQDEAFRDALFGLDAAGHTGVVEGEDGVYRIGRVSEIVPESVDPNFEQFLVDRGVTIESYREVVRADLVREALEEKILADVTGPGPQRRVMEIFIAAPDFEPADDAVKTRHILYSPKDDPAGAGQLDENDPAWSAAEVEARAAYEKIKADPVLFDEIAREDSDEGNAVVSGGKLPYFDPESQIDEKFAAAIFKEGLEPGQLLEPVRSSFGWHVIQIMYFPPDIEQANKIKSELEAGADFAALAREFSESESAADDGVLGWVAKGQLAPDVEEAIFAAPVGVVSDPVVIEDDGIYILKVVEEQVRTPEGDQLDELKAHAFNRWYTKKKQAFQITRIGSATAGVGT